MNRPDDETFLREDDGPDARLAGRLETELRHALRPVDPPAGFAERVLARAAAEPHAANVFPRSSRGSGPRGWVSGWLSGWLARTPGVTSAGTRAVAAVLLLSILVLGGVYERHVQRHRAVMLRERFELSVRITQATLTRSRDQAQDQTRRQLEQAGISPDAAGLPDLAGPRRPVR